MNILSRLAVAINQSFRLIFVSINKGIDSIFRLLNNAINLLSNLIRRLHNYITTTIQLVINISSLVFVFFVPIVFFFDPLKWSNFLAGILNPATVTWGRMVLGGFFSVVAYHVISGLIQSLRESAATREDIDSHAKHDIVKEISGAVSWVIIFGLFIYYLVFRVGLLSIIPENVALIGWFRSPSASTAPASNETHSGYSTPRKYQPNASQSFPTAIDRKSLNATLRLFESDGDRSPRSDHRFQISFSAKSTRYIIWELSLNYPKQATRTEFLMEAVWYKADGSIMYRHTSKIYIEKGSTSSVYSNGHGKKEINSWEVGSYEIRLFINGKIIAEQSFHVY